MRLLPNNRSLNFCERNVCTTNYSDTSLHSSVPNVGVYSPPSTSRPSKLQNRLKNMPSSSRSQVRVERTTQLKLADDAMTGLKISLKFEGFIIIVELNSVALCGNGFSTR